MPEQLMITKLASVPTEYMNIKSWLFGVAGNSE
jgi:hypothetical protein